MKGSFDNILNAARGTGKRIVLSEGGDPRVIEAALKAAEDGIAHPILVGKRDVICEQLDRLKTVSTNIEIIDPYMFDKIDLYIEEYIALRRHKGVPAADVIQAMTDPLIFAAMMVRLGDADGTISGAIATTSETVRAALQVIGCAQGVKTVSSFFLMLLNKAHHPRNEIVSFADCGLVIEPDVQELAQIAISSARSFHKLTGEQPRVAMLSFSSVGSAQHARVDRMIEATALIGDIAPEMVVDGELQFDAAFMPDVAALKAPNSTLKGNANVFIFPNLEAGNIGYKIAQRIGKAGVVGPILQGLAKPANDLSRGCTVEDVYRMIAVTAVQSLSD